MNVTQDLSILELVANASLVVKLVMLLLVVVSLQSWYWIFRKTFAIRDARARTDRFEREFWSGGDLNALYQSAANNRHQTGALERIFESGFREFAKLRAQKTVDAAAIVDGARRAMRATYQARARRHRERGEKNLAPAATRGRARRDEGCSSGLPSRGRIRTRGSVEPRAISRARRPARWPCAW